MALTVDQVAAELQIGLNRCYALVEAKVIPAFRVGDGSIRIPRDLLQAWCIARAMEETYGDGAGGLNLPPLLAHVLSGTLVDDAGAEGAAPESGRRGPAGVRRRPGRPQQSWRADER